MRLILCIAALAATAVALPQRGPWGGQRGWPWGQPPPRPTVVSGGGQQPGDIVLKGPNGNPVGTVTLGNGQQQPTIIITDGGNSNNNNGGDDWGNEPWQNEPWENESSDNPNTIVITGNGVDSTTISTT